MEMIAGCRHLGRVVFGLGVDVLAFLGTALRSRAALTLLMQFFGLLHTFVGEAMTLRLLADVWPGAPFGTIPPGVQENDRRRTMRKSVFSSSPPGGRACVT